MHSLANRANRSDFVGWFKNLTTDFDIAAKGLHRLFLLAV
jgi:hypothetical protein